MLLTEWTRGINRSALLRVQRGVGMCGIGSWMAVAECESVAGPTDATITTEVPDFSRLIFHKISISGTLRRRLGRLR